MSNWLTGVHSWLTVNKINRRILKGVHSFRLNDERGFSLIEQLFTVIIVTITMTFILPVLWSAMVSIKAEDFQVRAATITQEMIEATKAANFSDLTNGTYPTTGNGPTSSLSQSFVDFKSKVTSSSYLPSGTGTLIIGPASIISTSNEIKTVQVTVNWKQGELDKNYDVSTYIYNYVKEQ